MGFFDLLKSWVKFLLGKVEDLNEDVEKYKMQYSRYDDETLKRMFVSASGAKKIAIGFLLKERGYGS